MSQVEKAITYMENVQSVDIEVFDEDHEPIGPQLRFHLVDRGYAWEDQGVIFHRHPDTAGEEP